MPFWAGDTDLRQVVSSQFRGAFSLSLAVSRARLLMAYRRLLAEQASWDDALAHAATVD